MSASFGYATQCTRLTGAIANEFAPSAFASPRTAKTVRQEFVVLQETQRKENPVSIELSIVIPVYNASGCLNELHSRIVNTLNKYGIKKYEIILIDDASKDNSWEVIVGIANEDDHVRGFKLSRNFGQHHAITAGQDIACGERILIMDCDLQDRPEDIPLLLAKCDEGFDVVIARWVGRNDRLLKRISAVVFYRLFSWLAGYEYDPGIRSFRILSRVAADAMKSMREQMRSLAPLNIWLGFDTAYVDLEPSDRAAGKSSYNWRKLIRLSITNIVSFSDKPLFISVWLGFVMALLAFCYGGYIVARVLILGIPVPGWTTLITSLYFIGGLILANLGVHGVYLARTFDETKARPLYVISKRTVEKSTALVHKAAMTGE
jgi:polyisoprenyl-phosphate glycosyltransferase